MLMVFGIKNMGRVNYYKTNAAVRLDNRLANNVLFLKKKNVIKHKLSFMILLC